MHFYEYSRDAVRKPDCWESDNPNCYAHFHKSIELAYVVEGKIMVLLNGRAYEAEAGQLLIVPGYTIHSFEMPVQAKAWICTIPQDILGNYKQVLSNHTFSKLVIDSKAMADASGEDCLLSYFKGIRDRMNKEETLASRAEVIGYAYLILGYLIEHAGLEPVSSVKMMTFAQEVLNYLQEKYTEDCDLEDISGHFGYSKSRFSHLFNEIFGCRLVEYVNGLRCAHALTLLEEGHKTVTEIALESGFETTRTFYRAFRKYYGASPSDFVKGSQAINM